ncbi:efflux RND transporter periplasmic adaptor subunit [candidate division KSB1 bacterium]|nr:efflux RND transporter periplasmic adaptor subunit [candidate division KSB1 bacterium]
MSRKKILIALGVVIVIAIFVFYYLKKDQGNQTPVQVDRVKRGSITQMVSGSGKIQPEDEVKISANVSAEIIGLYVKEGDPVKKGQLLVELDRTKYVAAMEQAKSNKKSTEASLIKAKNDFERAQSLFNQKLTSKAELDNMEANLKLAESSLERAIALESQAEDDLAKTRIYSPLNGTVTLLNKNQGEIALGSMFQADVIMVVADLGRMEVVVEIDENDVVMVSNSDSALIEIDAMTDTVFHGIVSEIAHTATTRGRGTQEEVTNFEVKVAITDTIDGIRTGMSATVDIKTETRSNILYIPIQSVTVRTPKEVYAEAKSAEDKTKNKKNYTKDGKKSVTEEKTGEADGSKSKKKEKEQIEVVFVVEKGVAKISPVTTGISNDTHIEIKQGVQDSQQVVIGNYRVLSQTLKNGSAVKIAPAAGKEKTDKEEEK